MSNTLKAVMARHLLLWPVLLLTAYISLELYVRTQEAIGNDLASLSFVIFVFFVPAVLLSLCLFVLSLKNKKPTKRFYRGCHIASLTAHTWAAFLWLWVAVSLDSSPGTFAALVGVGAFHLYPLAHFVRLRKEKAPQITETLPSQEPPAAPA